MRVRLLAMGTRMPSWVNEGFYEYKKRFGSTFSFELIEIEPEKRTKSSDIPRLIEKEGEKILSVIKPTNTIISLEVKGEMWSTEKLTQLLKKWNQDGAHLDFIIGGPDGLSPHCLKKSNYLWSLSPLTLPHPLVRIMVIEQIYRAWSILGGHPYHR